MARGGGGKAATRAATVGEYLAGLPAKQRSVVAGVRELVRKHLPPGYEETMNWGMISYEIPLSRYPDTYNQQPLGYVAIAARKDSVSLYLLGAYADPKRRQALADAFEREGKKMDMGKSCLRFKALSDLPLDDLGAEIASMPVEEYIAYYESEHKR